MTRHLVAALLAVSLVFLGHVAAARAQGWSVEASAGRLVYDPALALAETTNLMGSLRYDTRRDTWIYGAAAVPAGDGGTTWFGGGAGGRVMLPVEAQDRVRIGADLIADAFSFHDRVVDQSGTGMSLEALPFARLSSGDGFVEARGGWRGHSLSFAGLRDNRGVFEAGGRGGYGTNLRVAGDARWVRASEGTYPFVGASLAYDVAHISVWGRVGKWLDADLDDGVWGLGTGVSLGPLTTLWGSLRQDGTDPLYWNVPRRTWSVGLTQRLTRTRVPLAPVAALASGDIVVTLPARDAPPGAVSIAGDFNQWQSAPMQREGEFWVVRLTLRPGVYHYTFRSASGDWFVPVSTAGRRSDGMGGFVAVLVVS